MWHLPKAYSSSSDTSLIDFLNQAETGEDLQSILTELGRQASVFPQNIVT